MARENIDVTVELHDQLSRPAKRAADAVDDLTEETKESAAAHRAAERAAKKHEKQLRALRIAAHKANQVDQSQMAKALAANADAASGSLGGLERQTKRTARGLKILGLALKVFKIQAIILAVSLLAAAVTALGAAAVAAVAGLSPLVGLLGGMPALMLAIGQGVGAVKLGFQGIGDAVKALGEGDPAKIAEAMEKLTPAGRELATTLADLVDGPLKRMQRRTQTAIAPGFTDALNNLRPILPIVTRGLERTGRVIGDLARDAAAAMDTPLFKGQLSRVMATNARAINLGGRAAGNFAAAGLAMADAFRPVQMEMSRYVLRAAEFINASVQAGNKSGALTEFFKDAWRLGKAVGQVLSDLTVGLFNVGKQSDVMGDMLGSSIASAASDWRMWTESVQGQNAIRQWFEDAVPVVQETIGLLRDLAVMFGGLSNGAELAPLMAQIRGQLLPAIQELTGAVSSDLGPAIINALTALVEFMTFLSASPMADILTVIATVLLSVATGLNALPGPLKAVVAGMLAAAGAAALLRKGLAVFGAAGGGGAVGTYFRNIGTAARDGSRGIGFFNRTAGGVMGATGAAVKGVRGLSGALGGPWGIAIMGATVLLGNWIKKQAEAKQGALDYAGALDQTTGAITDLNVEMARKGLLDSGAMADAEKLGLNLGDVTLAAAGNADAMARVNDQLDALQKDRGNFHTPWGDEAKLDAAHERLGDYLGLQENVAEAGRKNWELDKKAADQAAHAQRMANLTNRDAAAGVREHDLASQRFSGTVAGATTKLDGQSRATRNLITVTRELNGTLDARATWAAFNQSLIDSRKNLKGNADALRANGWQLDLTKESGIKAFNTFNDLATAAASVKGEAKQVAAYKELEKRIRQWGRDSGVTGKDLDRLVGDFIDVRKEIEKAPKEVTLRVGADGIPRTIQQFEELARAAQRAGEMVDNALGGAGKAGRGGAARDGAFVQPGQRWTVGEVGPELFVSASGVSVIGTSRREQIEFREPGVIVPNDVYQSVQAQVQASLNVPAAAAPSVNVAGPRVGGADVHVAGPRVGGADVHVAGPRIGGTAVHVAAARIPALAAVGLPSVESTYVAEATPVAAAVTVAPSPAAAATTVVPQPTQAAADEKLPDIHNHFHGDSSGITEADVKRAALQAWRDYDRERKERR